MSQLIVDVEKLNLPLDHFKKYQIQSINIRLIAQFLDIEHCQLSAVGDSNDKGQFSKLIVKNLPEFNDKKDNPSRVSTIIERLYIDQTMYQNLFINEKTKLHIVPGDPLDLRIISWGEINDMDNDGFIWEVLDMNILTIEEIRSLREFLQTKEGSEFLQM